MAASAPASATAADEISYLDQAAAAAIDEELMGALGFSVDQLMELAGLSCASALAAEYPVDKFPSVLVLAGPGNNGGDGLVAARHLTHFGYTVKVCYPKPTSKPLYDGLVTQCKSLGIPFTEWSDVESAGLTSTASVVMDALFGFSFKGEPRPPFDAILKALSPAARPPPIVSVDVPSGWHVEKGDEKGDGIRPQMLVSLTAPKLMAKTFSGMHHYLGGRFVPPAIRDKYSLRLPPFPGVSMVTKVAKSGSHKVADMRISYTRGALEEADFIGADPMKVWDEWFKAAVDGKVCEEPNAISLASVDASGSPSVRVVLLKGYDERGFILYTNYTSRKGSDLDGSGKAAFLSYWEALQRQVRIEGTVERLSEAESTAYFESRPKGSRIGAWASDQSKPIERRAALEAREAALQEQYAGDAPVPKPPHWGGYLIRPTAIEFWQGRPSRLHDRFRYTREGTQTKEWTCQRLQP